MVFYPGKRVNADRLYHSGGADCRIPKNFLPIGEMRPWMLSRLHSLAR